MVWPFVDSIFHNQRCLHRISTGSLLGNLVRKIWRIQSAPRQRSVSTYCGKSRIVQKPKNCSASKSSFNWYDIFLILSNGFVLALVIILFCYFLNVFLSFSLTHFEIVLLLIACIIATLYGSACVFIILISNFANDLTGKLGVCAWMGIVALLLTPLTWFGTPKDFW